MLELKQIEIVHISKYLQGVADKLKFQLKADGHYATGATDSSIKVVATSGAVKLRGLDSINKLSYGSPPQSQPNLYLDIVNWIKAKKMQVFNLKKFALMVTRKLQTEGYKVPNKYNDGQSVSKVIKPQQIENDLKEILGKEVALSVQSELIKNLKK